MNYFFYLLFYPFLKVWRFIVLILFFCLYSSLAILSRFLKKELFVFGSTPIINNKYWADSLKSRYKTLTIMSTCYSINNRHDFDKLFSDFIPKIFTHIPFFTGRSFAFIYLLMKAKVLHTSFDGFAFKDTVLEKYEPFFLKLAGIKIVILPYGGDCYLYSRVNDLSLRHVLIASYPQAGINEKAIENRVNLWLRSCDVYIPGAQLDGMPHWTLAPFNMLAINTENISQNNSKKISKCIRIVHSPNHKGIKGTEFLNLAVEELVSEGYDIELVILQGKKNTEVLEIMGSADIFADQFIIGYYGLSAVEAMAKGLPVLCNMENQAYNNVARRYGFLNECPILSTTPENIKENLRLLITNPALLKKLGTAGREYVEKYHSYETSRYMFGSIYAKIIEGKDIDLMNLFHPILSAYNKKKRFVEHPLINNNIPQAFISESKK